MAVPIDDKFVISNNGRKSFRKTTKGWYFLYLWKDGSTTWDPLKDLKESNPVDISEYVVGNRISEEVAFAWWVPYTLKKQDHIIAKVKARFLQKSHKSGVEGPTSVEKAYKLNKKNNNTLWHHAIKKEMTNVSIDFHILNHGEEKLVGYEHINFHLIFYVKMDFRRKAHFFLEATQQTRPRNPLMQGLSHEKVFVLLLI